MSDLPVTAQVVIPSADLSWSASRSSGPGGQNVNKVASKVDLRFDLVGTQSLTLTQKRRLRATAGVKLDAEGRVVIVSQATRDQKRNLDDARQRLAELVRKALVVPKRRKKTKPSKGAKRRRLEDKRRTSEKKKLRGRVDGD